MSNKFDALALPVDVPVRMPICHPHTLKPLTDADGNPAYLEILSTDSEAAVAYDRRAIEERSANPMRAKNSPADMFDAGCRRLAHLTRGWLLVDFDGNQLDVPFSEANAIELYSSHKMTWLREQALIFLGDRANFPLRSSKS